MVMSTATIPYDIHHAMTRRCFVGREFSVVELFMAVSLLMNGSC